MFQVSPLYDCMLDIMISFHLIEYIGEVNPHIYGMKSQG